MYKSKILNLITIIVVLIVCALPLYVKFVIWPSYDQFVMGHTEAGLEFLAAQMVKDQEVRTPFSEGAAAPQFLIDQVERIRKTVGLLKVKIFTPQGLIVYSSDAEDIGQFTKKEFFPQMLADGKSRSQFAQKKIRHDDGRELSQDIIESYVPIRHAGEAIGAFEIYFDVTEINRDLHSLTRRQLLVLVPVVLALLVAVLISTYFADKSMQALAKAKDRFQELSITDNLTGLLNYRGFKASAKQQLKIIDRGEKYAFLIFIDLNEFKRINDDMGHEMGDCALAEAAGILKRTFRESDIIGRLGGDEFAILAPQNEDLADEQAIGCRLEEQISRWNASHNEEGYIISMSYGIVAYSPQETRTLKEMLKKADAKMYENKQQKKEGLSRSGNGAGNR